MTLRGAIQQLRELHGNDDIPAYVKPAISKVIETLEMDAQEVRHGRWKEDYDGIDTIYECSVCGEPFVTLEGTPADNLWNYCPNCGALMLDRDINVLNKNCGAKMDEAEPDDTYCTEENCTIYQNDLSCERCIR